MSEISNCNRINKDSIINAILYGIKKTQLKYRNWVNSNKSISWGPEYLLTTYIAESIYESHPNLYVIPEGGIHTTMREAGSTTRLSGNKRSLNGRADIVVVHNDRPKYIVEVKNRVSRLEDINNDLDRLAYLILKEKDKTSLKYGVMAFVIDVDYKLPTRSKVDCIEKLDEKVKTLFTNAKQNQEYGSTIQEYYYEPFQEDEYVFNDTKRIWGWAAVVFVVKPTNIK